MQVFNVKLLVSCFVAFFALVNPIQKVFVITSLQKQFDELSIRTIAVKSTITALIILTLFLFAGQLIFNYIFHVKLYAFQITSGVVLFYNGITSLQAGEFLKLEKNISIKDITAVPIAMPMIAGPATITAAVTFPAHYGHLITVISIIGALVINLIFMLYSGKISTILNRINLMNPLIRIFGLIVATIGIQMILNGISGYVLQITG